MDFFNDEEEKSKGFLRRTVTDVLNTENAKETIGRCARARKYNSGGAGAVEWRGVLTSLTEIRAFSDAEGRRSPQTDECNRFTDSRRKMVHNVYSTSAVALG